MARNFDKKDAQMLIAQHFDLNSKLKNIENAANSFSGELGRLARSDNSCGIFSSVMQQELIGQQSFDTQIDRLISQIYKNIKYKEFASEASQIRSLYESGIRSKEALLSSVLGIRRLFSSSSSKFAANLAYDELKQMADGAYGQQVNALNTRFFEVGMPSYETASVEFQNHGLMFRDSLREAAPDVFDSRYALAEISQLAGKLAKLQASLDEVQSQQTTLRGNIKPCIDKLVTAETLNVLQTIPIEQITQWSAGIRVKSLRTNGYATMADVYTAKQYEIALISGISDEGARTIKHCASQCAKEAMSAVKLKINADARNKDTTAVVVATYKYRHILMESAIAAAMMRNEGAVIRDGLEKLNGIGAAVNWLFYDKENKETYCETYKQVKSLFTPQFCSEMEQHIEAAKPVSVSDDEAWNDFIEHNIEYFQLFEEIAPGLFGSGDSDYGLPEDLAKEIQEEAFFPDGLKCSLRRYQEWGVKYILHQERVLLGDEMGLGKTVQAIASMVSLRNTGATHFIVVCPASVLPNWYKEVQEKSKLKAFMVYGPTRQQTISVWKEVGGVAITNYETTGYFKLGSTFKYDMITVDEAHYIKNPDAQRSNNVRRLVSKAKRVLYMTGTPLENKVDEMITLINDLNPFIAGEARRNSLLITAPAFRNKIVPVYYRRKRTDVLTELPELIENKEWCIMTPQETAVYERVVLARKYADARRVSWNVDDWTYSSKAIRMQEIIAEAAADDRKVLIFSFFLSTIEGIQNLLGKQCLQPINGAVPIAKRQEIIDEFEKAPAGTVLLAQIQSGGTGLNIQSASVVILCEPQFKPSIENQAISRAYRMGQARNVFVHRLLCENSVDEKITDMLAEKQHLFDEFADKSVAAQESIALDDKTFGNIIEEEIERIKAKQEKEKQTKVS